jgi:hypothetical protein
MILFLIQNSSFKKYSFLTGCSGSYLKSCLLGKYRSVGSQFEDSPGKKFVRFPVSTNKELGMVVCACHLGYTEA